AADRLGVDESRGEGADVCCEVEHLWAFRVGTHGVARGRAPAPGLSRLRRRQALTPCSRSRSLRASLSCSWPSSRRLRTSSTGMPKSPPGKLFTLFAVTHTDQAGASPRGSSSPVCAS